MAKKTYLSLQQSEGLVFQSASVIYAAYISAGRVEEGDEAKWMERSIREAIRIAKTTDTAVISDNETGDADY
jgi:hypothetical protein